MADGATNTHVRLQIKRLRLSKGWTQRQLAQAAGISASSLGCLETGFYRFNLDTLQKIIHALGVEIVDVWPSSNRINSIEDRLPPRRPGDQIHFFRLGEVHSLAGAEAACIFTGACRPETSLAAPEEAQQPALRPLYTIHVEESEIWWLSQQLQEGKVTAPWAAYVRREGDQSLYLCLKNASIGPWLEELIHCYLSAWIAALPL